MDEQDRERTSQSYLTNVNLRSAVRLVAINPPGLAGHPWKPPPFFMEVARLAREACAHAATYQVCSEREKVAGPSFLAC